MSNQIILKKSSVGNKVPLTTDLAYGELALNYADGKLYFKNSSNAISSFSANIDLSGYASLTGTQTLTNKTLNGVTLTGAVTAGGNTGASGYILTSTGSGVQWVANSAGSLSGLSDVSITSPQAQQVLKYNGSIWQNANADAAVASAVFATNAQSDLGLVTDLVVAITEDLGTVTQVAAYIYNMGTLVVDGIVSLNNIDQSIKADYIAYSIIFGF
jgi:hypothetical protein